LITIPNTVPQGVFLSDWKDGAGDRDRTGDIQLGKLAFYRARVVYLPNAKPVPRNGLSGAALQALRFPAYSALIACCDRFTPLAGRYGQYGSGPKIFVEKLERETGLEPATFCLGNVMFVM
jgi:hypothetical protein